MRHLNIKNYRNFKEANFVLPPLVVLTGENNTGKTSLLKLIETITKNDTLYFKDTFFENVAIKDLLRKKNEPIEIFYSFEKKSVNRLENGEAIKPFFEKISINHLSKFQNPLITELVTSFKENEIIYFKLDYDFPNKSKITNSPSIRQITIKKIKGNWSFKRLFDNMPHNFIKEINDIINVANNDAIIWSFTSSLDKNDQKNIDIYDDYNFIDIDKKRHLYWINRRLSIGELYYLYSYLNSKNTKNNCNKENSEEQNKFRPLINHHRFYRDRDLGSKNFYYIDPLRPMFKEFYIQENFSNSTEDKLLLDSLKILDKNADLAEKVNIFFRSVSDIENISLDKINTKNSKTLFFPYYTEKRNINVKKKLKYSGTGISQLFPIVVTLLENMDGFRKRLGSAESIAIEQPELHLHPRAQNQLGKLFIDYLERAAHYENKISDFLIIETHSTFILDSMRKNIKIINESRPKTKHTMSDNLNIIYLYNQKNEIKSSFFSINNEGLFTGDYEKYNEFYLLDALEMLEI